jgi:hypothetical protein
MNASKSGSPALLHRQDQTDMVARRLVLPLATRRETLSTK